MGPETQVAAHRPGGRKPGPNGHDGPNGFEHSAGGVGGVFGSKNLKAIGVSGTGAVKLAAAPKDWKNLLHYVMSLTGANNQHVVPSTPQPWAEFTGQPLDGAQGVCSGARPLRRWRPANARPSDLNSIGLRTNQAVSRLGALAEKYPRQERRVRLLPNPLPLARRHAALEQYGVSRYTATACERGNSQAFFQPAAGGGRGAAPPGAPGGGGRGGGPVEGETPSSQQLEMGTLGAHMIDDYGIWTHYSQLNRDFAWAYRSGVLKTALPADE